MMVVLLATAVVTNAVVASAVVFVPAACVAAVTAEGIAPLK